MTEQAIQTSVVRWEYFVLVMSLLAAVATSVAAIFTYRAYVWNNRRRDALSGGLETFKPIDAKSSRYEKASQVTSLIAVTVTLFGVFASIGYSARNHQLQNLQDAARRDLAKQVTVAANQAHEAMLQDAATAVELKAAYEDLAKTKLRLSEVEKRTDDRTLTKLQETTLFSMLKPEAPQQFILFLAPDPEAQRFADKLIAVMTSAGWKSFFPPNNFPKLQSSPPYIWIFLGDVNKSIPRAASTLRMALKKIGIEAQYVPLTMLTENQFALYIGPKPAPKQ